MSNPESRILPLGHLLMHANNSTNILHSPYIRHMDVYPPKTMKKKYCSALYSVLGNIDTET
jgi:hypothetical protein